MASAARARPEADRIALLLERDGHEATRAWVERTLGIYRDALRAYPDSYYAPLFEQSIAEFREWLARNERPAREAPAVHDRTAGPGSRSAL